MSQSCCRLMTFARLGGGVQSKSVSIRKDVVRQGVSSCLISLSTYVSSRAVPSAFRSCLGSQRVVLSLRLRFCSAISGEVSETGLGGLRGIAPDRTRVCEGGLCSVVPGVELDSLLVRISD